MKTALTILILICSVTTAHALQVGDNSFYTGNFNGDPLTISLSVSEIVGDTYNAAMIVTIGQQTGTGVSNGTLSEIAEGNMQFKNCLALGGTLESVLTPARAFTACHLSAGVKEIYLSPEVPFGFVKSINNKDGNHVETLLQSYRMQ